jgi:hypothetical protein
MVQSYAMQRKFCYSPLPARSKYILSREAPFLSISAFPALVSEALNPVEGFISCVGRLLINVGVRSQDLTKRAERS